MQSNRVAYHSNTNIIINNYFINSQNTSKKISDPSSAKQKIKNKKCNEFILTEKKILANYSYYLKTYDVLTRNKMNERNFRIAYRLTWLLSKLLIRYNALYFDRRSTKILNISYALHELKNKSHVLFDISGNKDKKYAKTTDRFVNLIQQNRNNPLVQEFYQLLEYHHLSASLVTQVSDDYRPLLYRGPKYCSEKSLYIEIEKNCQQRGKKLKVSTANFCLRVGKNENRWFITALHPHFSCKDCQYDHQVKEYYRAKNSKIVYDDKGNKKIICDNLNKLNTYGNLPSRELSPPRTRELTFLNKKTKNRSHFSLEINHSQSENAVQHLPIESKNIVKDFPSNSNVSILDKLSFSISKFIKFVHHQSNTSTATAINIPNMQETQTKPKEKGGNINQAIDKLSSVIKRLC